MSEKLLSISIAAYNAETTLEKAVSSCIVDDDRMLEKLDIIIVNDGSEDGTYQLARKLQNKFPSIRIVDKLNGGYGSTVNAAMEIAEGKYFKLLDADDWYDTENLLKLLYELDNIDSDMIITNYTEIRTKGKTLISYRLKKEICHNIAELTDHFSMHAVMYKTEILRNNNIRLQEGISYTDTEFVAYPLLYIKTVAFYPYNIYQYSLYGEEQSVSIQSRIKHISDAEMVVTKLEQYLKNLSNERYISEVVKNKMIDASKFYINSLILTGNKESKKKLKSFDGYLKKNWNYIYKKCASKTIIFLRVTNYLGYEICRLILKRTLK